MARRGGFPGGMGGFGGMNINQLMKEAQKMQADMEKSQDGSYTAELIIAKFRNGQPGSVYLGWDGSRTSFVNLEKDANEQSMVAQFEKNDDAKRAKMQNKTPEDFKNAVNSVVQEISADESLAELAPPPEFDMPPVDFSDISIPSDDELF